MLLLLAHLDHAIFINGRLVPCSVVLRRLGNVRVPWEFEVAIHCGLCKLVGNLLLEFNEFFFDFLIHIAWFLQRPTRECGYVTVREDRLILRRCAVAARFGQRGDHATRGPFRRTLLLIPFVVRPSLHVVW